MINTEKHLLYILKTDMQTINKLIDNIDSYYVSWDRVKLNKDTGLPMLDSDNKPKVRPINSTKEPLKSIQKRIYSFLIRNVELPEYCYGGVPKKDNIRNARFHQGNKYVFTTDIKSFFPSINNNQVFALYRSLSISPTIARYLTQLTTYKGKLPQGVPTSTLLANLVFSKVGDKINAIAKEHNIKFSIFVDDVTMSSNIDFKNISLDVIDLIKSEGFKISHKKTNYKTKNPIITGVKCQNNRLKLQQSSYKRLSKLKQDQSTPQYKGLLQYRKRVDSI